MFSNKVGFGEATGRWMQQVGVIGGDTDDGSRCDCIVDAVPVFDAHSTKLRCAHAK